MKPDKRAIACNYAEATKICKLGAKAFVVLMNRGNGSERIFIKARSRGGRWIEKYEAIRRLEHFRFVTIPPENPLYSTDIFADAGEQNLSELNQASFREKARRMGVRQ